MASVSSSNTFSVAAHSTNGMSGLISGMDTDGMVQQMLAGTQNKIDKQEALTNIDLPQYHQGYQQFRQQVLLL